MARPVIIPAAPCAHLCRRIGGALRALRRPRPGPGGMAGRADPPRRLLHVSCTAADPYTVLGVSRSASAKEIKSAFRQKALKLHPDVNKAPDAAQRFSEAKAAYQTLTDPSKRQAYERRASSGGFGGFGGSSSSWGGGGSGTGGYGGGGAGGAGGRSRQQQAAEEEYSFGQFWSDLTKEVSDWSREEEKRQQRGERAAGGGRSAAGGGGASGREKSLWEELADLGDELADFLEKELGIEDEDPARPRGKYDYIDEIDRKYKGSTASASSSSSSSPPGARGASAGSSSSSRTNAAPPPPPPRRKTRAEEVDDELAALKRKMGL